MGNVAGLPANQQDALPLQTIAQALQPTTQSLVGSAVSKYWSDTDLGISGAVPSTMAVGGGNVYYLATPFLDLRGCKWFTFLFERLAHTDNGTSALQYATAFTLYAQYRTSPSDTPPIMLEVSSGSVSGSLSGYVGLGPYTGLGNFGASDNNVRQREAITFGATFAQNGGNAPQLAIGTDARLIVNWSTSNPRTGHDASTFSAWLWGAS